MSQYQIISRGRGHAEARRFELPIIKWGSHIGSTIGSTEDGACFAVIDGFIYSWFRQNEAIDQNNHTFILGEYRADIFTPQKINGPENIVGISIGDHSALALDSMGSIWAWGDNSWGQCGIEPHPEDAPWSDDLIYITARKFPGVSDAVYVDMSGLGTDTGTYISNTGEAWSWGRIGMSAYTANLDKLMVPDKIIAVTSCSAINANKLYIDEIGDVHAITWLPIWYREYLGESPTSNISNYDSIAYESGKAVQEYYGEGWLLTNDNNLFLFDHSLLRLIAENVLQIGSRGAIIQNNGEWKVFSYYLPLLFRLLSTGPFTEASGIVARSGNDIYTINPDRINITKVQIF